MALSALHTDLYELTMLAGYLEEEIHHQPAAFELYFRKAPFNGSFAVFAGLQPALDYLENLVFREDEINYLESLSLFTGTFLEYLRHFRFRGKVTAPAEGTLVFPNEPLLTVEGTLAEAQFVETALLNIINFQTLAATKAARLTLAAGDSEVIEFGLRRSQGPDGGLGLARAAFIGGVRSTSNLLAGQTFNIPVKGTHAHSWVMTFDDELQAFRAYADIFPDKCILLVDTYDTLTSGVPNAIKVASELREKGYALAGVRLDSGNLGELSRRVRKMLDDAGFPEVKIVASDDLDEYKIADICRNGGQIDIYGIGTRLATCAGEGGGSLGGVYKLVRLNGQPRLKTTNEQSKKTLPDRKQVWRISSGENNYLADILALTDEPDPSPEKVKEWADLPDKCSLQNIRTIVMADGMQSVEKETLDQMADRCQQQLSCLPNLFRMLQSTEQYPVNLTPALRALQQKMMDQHQTSS